MKIVFLDRKSIGDDCSVDGFKKFGELICYDVTPKSKIVERVKDADIILTNKVVIDENIMKQCTNLKYIGISATGYNNIDIDAARKLGVAVTNVTGYSTDVVAQHTFALLLKLVENLDYYDKVVKDKTYSEFGVFTWLERPFIEIAGKTWGIIGLGEIGRKTAKIATAFGCKVIYYSASGKNNNPDYERVDLDTLLAQSDIVSVHAPLNDATKHLMNYEAFSKMKKTAYFINVGRGAIDVEEDLARAIDDNLIAGAGIDVFETEPLPADSPLLKIKNAEKIVMTPHIAWAGVEARNRLIKLMCDNIDAYISGERVNRLD